MTARVYAQIVGVPNAAWAAVNIYPAPSHIVVGTQMPESQSAESGMLSRKI